MPNLIRNSVSDGQVTFEKGVDTYRAPTRVPRNQSCLLINQTTRQDFVGPRPGWKQVSLRFFRFDTETDRYTPDPAVKEGFETGYFQGANSYVPDKGPSHIVLSISGHIYKAGVLDNGIVQEAVLANGSAPDRPSNLRQAWFKQAEIFLVIQDGQSKPLIYTGDSMRESDVDGKGGTDANGKPLKEVPVGTCMEYSGGRLWVTLPNGRSFVAGDGVYGPTGTEAYGSRDSVLRFTENQYLTGLPFAVPANMGPIRAMVALANLDTSLGQGPMQVFTPSGAFSVQAPFDRALWALVTDPIKTVSLLDQGALSPWATVLVNGDVWYRSLDGVRSFFIARRDFGTWGNRSMSYEVIKHLKDDNIPLLDHCSGALFDNRLLITSSPQHSTRSGTYHRGLVVDDFIPLTSQQGTEPPCWDGLWTGHDILQILNVPSQGNMHCFAIVLAPYGDDGLRRIQIWELMRDRFVDIADDGSKARIARALEGPRLDFNNRLEHKTLETCEIWADNVRGTVDFALFYKPDDYPCWFFWKSWEVCATIERCSIAGGGPCTDGMNLKPQYRYRMTGTRPPDNTIAATKQAARVGYTFQYRLETVGEAEITAIKIGCTTNVQETFGSVPESDCTEIVCCSANDFAYPPRRALVGIVEEDTNIWITTEDNVVFRTEGQEQVNGAGGGGGSGGGGGGGNNDGGGGTVTSPPAVPAWPIPPEYPCLDRNTFGPLVVQDPITMESLPVGCAPGSLDPVTYLAQFPGCLEAWANDIWSQFVAAKIPFTQARIVFAEIHTTGFGFMAIQVYPEQAGGYGHVIDLDTKLIIEYCPPPP